MNRTADQVAFDLVIPDATPSPAGISATAAMAAMYATVVASEAPNAAQAFSIDPPTTSTSGWTIGFIQEDLYANAPQAERLLQGALVASGAGYDTTSAAAIASRFTAAGTSSSVSLSGIQTQLLTPLPTNLATISAVNAALKTSGAESYITTQSPTDFQANYNPLPHLEGRRFWERRPACDFLTMDISQ